MKLSTLADWLAWIDQCHTQTIDLGLDRVETVARRLSLIAPACPVITVGGTNGKGSTVRALESLYLAAGFRVGAFTSPVIYEHNEYARVNGQSVSDKAFCDAYTQIEAVRGEVTLTPFEFHALAALCIFKSSNLDVLLLEVGLGGRLDAVNILDADVAIVTSISLDHQSYLGNTVEEIAREKAGIFRKDKPAIIGEANPPMMLIEEANRIGAMVYQQDNQFGYQQTNPAWSWQYQATNYTFSALPKLSLQNLSCALMAITLMQERVPVSKTVIENVLPEVTLPGRLEVYCQSPLKIRDVAHNPGSVEWLATYLKQLPRDGKTHAVFSMLEDKEMTESLTAIDQEIDVWHVAPLKTKRAASVEKLKASLSGVNEKKLRWYGSVREAYDSASGEAGASDRVVTFGSFHVLGEV